MSGCRLSSIDAENFFQLPDANDGKSAGKLGWRGKHLLAQQRLGDLVYYRVGVGGIRNLSNWIGDYGSHSKFT